MKIAFYDDGRLDYTPDTPFEQPLGGTESCAAYLSAALAARGHEVALVNRVSQPGIHRGVMVRPGAQTRASFLNRADVVISLTHPVGAKLRSAGVTVPMINWQHKGAYVEPSNYYEPLAERDAWSGFVFVSDHQKDLWTQRFGLDGTVLRNAVSPAVLAAPPRQTCFLDRGEDPVLIYASPPGRGLELLLASFAALREQVPNARLRLCSDGGTYQKSGARDTFSALYSLARVVPGVEFIGSVSQTALGEALTDADILAYPAITMETACIVAMEAAACGCLFAGADYGALSETMAGFGVFTPYNNSRSELSRGFGELLVREIAKARADPETYKAARARQTAFFRETHNWERRAAEWEAWLEHALPGMR